jgi:hypothetical protein
MLFELSRPLEDLASMLLNDLAGRQMRMRDIYRQHSVDKPYIESEKSPSVCPSPRTRRQSPRFSMSACFDSSIRTSRGFAVVASLCTDEMKDAFETLKCRLRFVISFRATALSIGAHSVTTQKFA